SVELRRCRRKVAAQQRDSVDDSMQVNNDLTAHPIDIVATFAAQRPRHCRQCARVRLLAVVFVSADVPILAEGAPHVARGEKDRARALRAAIEQLLAGMMEMGADPRTGGELASAELGTCYPIDLAIPRTKIAVGEHAVGKFAAQLQQARSLRRLRQ